jgi:hypothetical protein
VAAALPGAGKPSGSVVFQDGTKVLATVALSASGQATFSTTALAAGTHHITANYAGDGNFAASVAALDEVVQAASGTALTSSQTTAVYGEKVTFTAAVTGPLQSAPPGGHVVFKDGNTVLGTEALDATGHAVFSTTTLGVGSHHITASYSGDNHYPPSASLALTEQVNKANSAATVTTSASPAVPGQKVTFTATVAAALPGAGKPSGSVVFQDGTKVLATVALSASGQASFSTTALAAGTHHITANYAGDGNFAASVAALDEVVRANSLTASVTALASSASSAVVGQAVTLTATVTPALTGSAKPTGKVVFLDGDKVLGTGTIDASGQATFSTSALVLGSHHLKAEYSGDSQFADSSAALDQLIIAATPK